MLLPVVGPRRLWSDCNSFSLPFCQMDPLSAWYDHAGCACSEGCGSAEDGYQRTRQRAQRGRPHPSPTGCHVGEHRSAFRQGQLRPGSSVLVAGADFGIHVAPDSLEMTAEGLVGMVWQTQVDRKRWGAVRSARLPSRAPTGCKSETSSCDLKPAGLPLGLQR